MFRSKVRDRNSVSRTVIMMHEIVLEIICTGCLVYMLLFFCNMGNTLYQAPKNIWAAKAIFMLAVFLFFTQRPKLWNWQSLAVSLLYIPFGLMYRNRYFPDSPDLFEADKIVSWLIWILLLIAVDMAVYKKVNSTHLFNKKAVIIWVGLTISMIFFRNGRVYPVILLLISIFYLMPLDSQKWRRVVNQICNAWMIVFLVILYQSVMMNPDVSDVGAGRWYGNFLNIGDFGRFMACTIAVFVYRFYQVCKLKGAKKLVALAYVVPFLLVVWTLLRVSTITMYIAIVLSLVMCFVVLTKKGTGRSSLIRLAIAVVLLGGLAVGGFLMLRVIGQSELSQWSSVLESKNPLMKPVSELVRRAHYMFNSSASVDTCIFEPGSLISQLDLFASGRLSICAEFIKEFRLEGNVSFGIQVGDYWAYNAHNEYVQILFEYGYIGGGLFIVWLIYNMVSSAVQYIRDKKQETLLTCIWMAMLVGVLTGEMINLFDFSFVTALMLCYPNMIKLEE